MREDTLCELDDARVRSAPSLGRIELADDGLKLGGFVIATAGRFDDARVAALLAAAYGDALPRTALAYLKGALLKQRNGQTPLALTYLALAGVPPLADVTEASWRLSKADEVMKAGVTPATIVEALAPRHTDFARAYNPDQPRVPAGSGQTSGQWTSGDWAASNNEPASAEPASTDSSGQAAQSIQITDNSSDWTQYLNPTSSAQAADATRPPFNGRAPNDQHAAGVEQAMEIYASRGFAIESPRATAVIVPGFATPRMYDFIVYDPVADEYAGIEVKTTLYDTIKLNQSQLDQDVAVYTTGGAYTSGSRLPITKVGYVALCAGCSVINLRPVGLAIGLLARGIRTWSYQFPGGEDHL
jgi:hypothetical protein